MSNETDLDLLARNVHEWPAGKCEVLVRYPRNVATLIWSSVSSDAGWITKDQWLARRAELQNKPSWALAPEWADWLAQDAAGLDGIGAWWWYRTKPTKGDRTWSCKGYSSRPAPARGEVLGDWRDTLEQRPQVEADITDPFDPEFRSVSVSNDPVLLEQPVVVAGTGNGSASESAFLIGRVIDLLRTSVDHFSADELADLNELTGAELTKRDAAVCGGQKYLDAHWFERGELPPVGIECEAIITSERQWVKIEVVCHRDGFALGWCPKERCGYHGDEPTDFRHICTERDVLIDLLGLPRWFADQTLREELAEAILAAGFSLGAK